MKEYFPYVSVVQGTISLDNNFYNFWCVKIFFSASVHKWAPRTSVFGIKLRTTYFTSMHFIKALAKRVLSVKQPTIHRPSSFFFNCTRNIVTQFAAMQAAQLTCKLLLRTRRLKILCKGYKVVALQGFPSISCKWQAICILLTGTLEAQQLENMCSFLKSTPLELKCKHRTNNFSSYSSSHLTKP